MSSLCSKSDGEDNPAYLLTKHLPSDKMVRCLGFMGAAFREGRPAAAPMRKEHERITGEYLDWQLAETARNELDDDKVETRLMAECSASGGCNKVEYEDIMKVDKFETDKHDFEEDIMNACCLVCLSPAAGLAIAEESAAGN